MSNYSCVLLELNALFKQLAAQVFEGNGRYPKLATVIANGVGTFSDGGGVWCG